MVEVLNLVEKFGRVPGFWQPKIIGELNDSYVKLVRLQGEFFWHKHAVEDELFLVMKGTLKIRLRDRDLVLHEGELVIIPKGVEHLPVAEEEVWVVLLEPKTTVNTGDVTNERTIEAEWLE